MPSAATVRTTPLGPPRSAPSRVALFDLDRTLLPGSSLAIVARHFAAAGLVSRRTAIGALARQAAFRRRGASRDRAERLCREALELVAGCPVEIASEILGFAAIEVAAALRPSLLEAAGRHASAGDRCLILSASPHDLVADVAARAGFDGGVGTRLEVRDGRLTGRLDGPFCHAEGKLARLRDEIGIVDLLGGTAYADAGTDLPVLQAASFPVAVNPDRAMRKAARAAHWPILTGR